MDNLLKNSLDTVEERDGQLLSVNKTEGEAVVSGPSDGDSIVEKVESDSCTSEELQIFNDNAIGQRDDKETSPFQRRGLLPPRAPVSSVDVETERVLPSQPSIIRRMMEPNKRYVDPKDARTLLPGVLFKSGSLDLEGAIEDGAVEQAKETEEARENENRRKEAALLHFLRTKELERINESLLYGQQQQDPFLDASSLELLAALNEPCRVPAANNLLSTPTFQQDMAATTTTTNNLLNQMMQRPRHVRSISEPSFAFQDAFQSVPPFQNPLNAPTSIVDPNAEALALLRLTTGGNFPTQNWPGSLDLQQPQNVGNLFVNDHPQALVTDLLTQSLQSQQQGQSQQQDLTQQQQPQQQQLQQQGRSRKKTGPSRSVDFTAATRQSKHKGNEFLGKEKNASSVPAVSSAVSSAKAPSKAEVKKLVEKQTSIGKPTYAPWFREKTGQIRSNPNSNITDDFQINGGNLPSPRVPVVGMFPGHSRSQSTPGISFNIADNETTTTATTPPAAAASANQTPKSKGVGTGVFLPRLPT